VTRVLIIGGRQVRPALNFMDKNKKVGGREHWGDPVLIRMLTFHGWPDLGAGRNLPVIRYRVPGLRQIANYRLGRIFRTSTT
jgi:hypothetical protein